jgi:hypothetical protein
VSSHLSRLWDYYTIVKVRDTLYLLGLFITVNVHHIRWDMKGCLLCVMHVNMFIGILQINVEFMDLLFQELDHCLVLTYGGF